MKEIDRAVEYWSKRCDEAERKLREVCEESAKRYAALKESDGEIAALKKENRMLRGAEQQKSAQLGRYLEKTEALERENAELRKENGELWETVNWQREQRTGVRAAG